MNPAFDALIFYRLLNSLQIEVNSSLIYNQCLTSSEKYDYYMAFNFGILKLHTSTAEVAGALIPAYTRQQRVGPNLNNVRIKGYWPGINPSQSELVG
jgi:hypothetical protein